MPQARDHIARDMTHPEPRPAYPRRLFPTRATSSRNPPCDPPCRGRHARQSASAAIIENVEKSWPPHAADRAAHRTPANTVRGLPVANNQTRAESAARQEPARQRKEEVF